MDFGFYLPCYWPDTSLHMREMYRDVVSEAQFAEELGYVSFTIPEHHFTNALVHPNALLTAVRVAAATQRAPLITSTTVLPFHDVRILAGEIAQADCLTDGRIQIGAGSGAYQYEFERLEIPMHDKRERFDDSLKVLIKLLSEEDVSWESPYYKFPATTITPRPVQKPHPPIWFAAMSAPSIEKAVLGGFNVITTPLREPFEKVIEQAGGFARGVGLAGDRARGLRLSMLVMLFVTESEAQKRAMLEHALGRHRRFVNVYQTRGEVRRGAIKPYDVDLTLEEIETNLIIGPPGHCRRKLEQYAAQGIHNMQLNMNFGASHAEVMRSLEVFAREVMPHFA
ncbi:MAG TPA: LLM class flavin-dependent oxidoreductase [Alphaproteobacteria bacterium]|nr:LLM class flavin-dependent oxidoreductase [Alphaproteobacteria bacterium]